MLSSKNAIYEQCDLHIDDYFNLAAEHIQTFNVRPGFPDFLLVLGEDDVPLLDILRVTTEGFLRQTLLLAFLKGAWTPRSLLRITAESKGSLTDRTDPVALFTKWALFHWNISDAAQNVFLVCLHEMNVLIYEDYTNTKVIYNPHYCTCNCKEVHLWYVCLERRQVYRKQTPSLMVYGWQFPVVLWALIDENFLFFCIVFTYQLPIY